MWRSCRLLSQTALHLMTVLPAGTARTGMGTWLACWSNCSSGFLQQQPPAGKKPLHKPGYAQSIIVCHFPTAEKHNVSYGELKDLLESKAIQLIDVREKWEIGELGKIPGSINIPLHEVIEALQMNPERFKKIYNQDMPSKSDHLVFVCMAGVRSKQARDAANSLGFGRAQHYIGGFQEWAEHESSGETGLRE